MTSDNACWEASVIEKQLLGFAQITIAPLLDELDRLVCSRDPKWSDPSLSRRRKIDNLLSHATHPTPCECTTAAHRLFAYALHPCAHQLVDALRGLHNSLDPSIVVAWEAHARSIQELSGRIIWIVGPDLVGSERQRTHRQMARLLLHETKSLCEQAQLVDVQGPEAQSEISQLRIDLTALHRNAQVLRVQYATPTISVSGDSVQTQPPSTALALRQDGDLEETIPRNSQFVAFASRELVRRTSWTDDDLKSVYRVTSATTHGLPFRYRIMHRLDPQQRIATSVLTIYSAIAMAVLALDALVWEFSAKSLPGSVTIADGCRHVLTMVEQKRFTEIDKVLRNSGQQSDNC